MSGFKDKEAKRRPVAAAMISEEEIVVALRKINYEYDEEKNQFV